MTNQGKRAVDTLLAESLKELTDKHPIEKITIKQITDKAGVIRPTFYNHFQDKYELLEWMIRKELLEPALPLLKNGMVDQALVLLFTTMLNERNFYSKASRLEGQNSFGGILRNCIKKELLQIMTEQGMIKAVKYNWLTPDSIAEYYAQSVCFVAMSWIRSGMAVPVKELVDAYKYITKYSLEDILAEIYTN